jgi:hypothetical protein
MSTKSNQKVIGKMITFVGYIPDTVINSFDRGLSENAIF